MDASHDGGDGVSQEELDVVASGSTKKYSTHWLQIDFHQKGGTFKVRWSDIQVYAYSQRVLTEERS